MSDWSSTVCAYRSEQVTSMPTATWARVLTRVLARSSAWWTRNEMPSRTSRHS